MKMGNEKPIVIGIVIGVLLFWGFVVIGAASAATIFVPDDYAKVQWAVDNAAAGDTIIVSDGIYIENVNVNKRLTIRSENGSANCIIQAKNSDDHVFEVTASYVNISGFMVKGAIGDYKTGIKLYDIDHCNISNNIVSNNYRGIYLDHSSSNNITNNIANSNRYYGIWLDCSSNNNIANNIANSNYHGIHLDWSSDNNIANSIASNNHYGIRLFFSSNNNLTNNTMSGNRYNFHIMGVSLPHYIQNIDTSNKVDGKPIYYWVDQQNQQIPDDAGFAGVVNSMNITVKGLTLTKNHEGVLFICTKNSRVENINALNNYNGISLDYDSNNNNITNNNASNNNCGISLAHSSNNNIINNIANLNEDGIWLFHSSNNNLINNTMSGNRYNFGVWSSWHWYLPHYIQNIDTSNKVDGKPIYYWVDEQDQEIPNDAGYVGIVNSTNITVRDLVLTKNWEGVLFAYTIKSKIENVTTSDTYRGIYLVDSSNNNLTNNTVSNNEDGIYLEDSSNNNLTNNTVSNNEDGIGLSGSDNTISYNDASNNRYHGIGLSGFDNTISNNDASNNGDYGIRLSGSDNTISNNDASNNGDYGIRLSGSDNTISNNNASNNEYGIYLHWGSNNTITNNTANSNKWNSICLYYSSNNKIYLNNFINNNVYSSDSTSIWNSTSKIIYTYNGSTYVNYLGNYWDDYRGTDADEDGIGDTPYSINSDKDSYPLMEPFEHYFEEAIPTVSISTDKYEYTAGDTMSIAITIANPTEELQPVYFAWRFDLPDYGEQYWITVLPLDLAPGYEQTFPIPWELGSYGFSFNAAWYVALYNTTTLEVFSEDTADWRYVPGKMAKGEIIPEEIAKEITKEFVEIELPSQDAPKEEQKV